MELYAQPRDFFTIELYFVLLIIVACIKYFTVFLIISLSFAIKIVLLLVLVLN